MSVGHREVDSIVYLRYTALSTKKFLFIVYICASCIMCVCGVHIYHACGAGSTCKIYISFLSCWNKMSDINNLKGENICLAPGFKGFSPPHTESTAVQSHHGGQEAERGRDKDGPLVTYFF